MIQRELYLKRLLKFEGLPVAKVVTGIRRCGKSTLLEHFQAELLARGDVEKAQIVSLNFDDLENRGLLAAEALYDFVCRKLVAGKRTYIFLDEVQNVVGFQRVVDSLLLKKGVDLYLTGSNAWMLSGELATLLSGRYVTIPLLPLSFSEYFSAGGEAKSVTRAFAEYRDRGGFPFFSAISNPDPEFVRTYFEGVYSTVVLKDVASRNQINDTLLLESVIRFLADNVGKIFSTKKIADALTSAGRKISVLKLESYLAALTDAFIFYRVKRYDVKGKQYLKTGDKYYIADPGLRNFLLGNKGGDEGFLLENVVYLELLRRGYEVFIGKVGELEIDFVAIRGNERVYIQVSLSVRDPETLARELRPLQKLTSKYACILLTLDDDPEADFDGIRRANVVDWLLEH